jgi:hypothetical protein
MMVDFTIGRLKRVTSTWKDKNMWSVTPRHILDSRHGLGSRVQVTDEGLAQQPSQQTSFVHFVAFCSNSTCIGARKTRRRWAGGGFDEDESVHCFGSTLIRSV